MRVLGIDPGSSRIGYGLIEDGAQPLLITYGTIEVQEKNLAQKLSVLGEKLSDIIKETQPEAAAVETIYFSKNQKTAIEVAQARGVIMYLLERSNIPILECGPNEMKKAVTGYGNTDKKGVEKMVAAIFGIERLKGHDDASDAVAIALAGARLLKIPR